MFAFTNSCSCVRVVVFMSAVGVWDFLRGDSRELWMSMLQHFQFPLELITPKGSIIYQKWVLARFVERGCAFNNALLETFTPAYEGRLIRGTE